MTSILLAVRFGHSINSVSSILETHSLRCVSIQSQGQDNFQLSVPAHHVTNVSTKRCITFVWV